MSNKKSELLLHVQSRAIRKLIFEKVDEGELVHRYTRVTGKTTRMIHDALKRLDKPSLIGIVEISPEINADDINDCFEENRYSSRPNLKVYMVRPKNPSLTGEQFVTKWNGTGTEELNQHLLGIVHGKAAWQVIEIKDSTKIAPTTLEWSFSYQSRYNYIDPSTEDTNHVYELRYGFVWVNVEDKFAVVSCPADGVGFHVIRAVEEKLGLFATPISITGEIAKAFFPTERLKSRNLFHHTPEDGRPQRLTVSDAKLGDPTKQKHLEQQYGGYESKSSLYDEEIDVDFMATLRVNAEKGRLSLSRQLRTSQLRSWGLARVKPLMQFVNGLYKDNELEQLWNVLNLEENPKLQALDHSGATRDVVLDIIKAILLCKKKGVSSMRLVDQSPQDVITAVGRHTTAVFRPWCETCENYIELHCPECGQSTVTLLKKKRDHVIVRCECDYEFTLGSQTCFAGHPVQVSSFYEGVEMVPNAFLSQTIADIINECFGEIGYNHETENFYLRDNDVYYHKENPDQQILFKVSELPQFKKVWNRRISNSRRESIYQIMHIMKEKCKVQSTAACTKCQREKSVKCVMKPFVAFTDHELHPHHGQEFGDVSFHVDIGAPDKVFVGIAKSYTDKAITPSSDTGREMIQQFLGKCTDATVDAIGLIVCAPIDQELKALCVHLARLHQKKVIIWEEEEMLRAIDYAISHFKLTPDAVHKSIREDKKPRMTTAQRKKRDSA